MYEETGFDISPLILPDAFLELQIKEQRVKLYIIPGVPTNTLMCPQTRKEISMIGWIRLVDLPGYSNRNKQTHPGIKLYMVTPFLSGLRKWITRNRHRKGKLVPVEEDVLEDVIQDEVVQNGTTDDLIAMLRKQQQQQPSSSQEVDLLGMLRNESQPQYPTPAAQEHYYPPAAPSNSFFYTFQGNPAQSSDLLQFSPYIAPVSDSIQEPSRSVEPQPMPPENLPDARRNSLLSILKRGPNLASESNVVNPPLLDMLKGSQSAPVDTAQQQQVVESAKVDHRQSLLTALKNPQLSSTTPTTSSKPPTPHQTALLSALKSPPISHATPPPSQSPKAMPTTPSAHQSALLATLKLPPKPTPPPKQSEAPSTKKGPVVQAPTTSNHQNALLAALTSPKVQPSKPPTNQQSSLLAALKSPPIQTTSPKPVTIGQTANSQAVPGGSTEIPVQPTVASLLLRVKSPPVPRTTPSPTHQSSLLSALERPTFPPASSSTQHQSSLLNALKNPPIARGRTSSALKNPKPGSSMEKQREVTVNKGTEAKNAHMESLLRTLKSPSESPVVEKVVPESYTDERTKGDVKSGVVETEVAAIMSSKQCNAEEVTNVRTPPVSSHVFSLLSSLKGSSAPISAPPTRPAIAPAQNSPLSDLMDAKPSTPEVSNSPERAPEVIPAISNQVTSTTVRTSPSSTKSLLDILKGPRPNGTPPSNSPTPTPTSHQKSLLSLLNPPSRQSPPPPAKAESKPSSSSKGQEFNFSPTPQIGKRIKFREILVPGGRKEVTPEPPSTGPKSNGTIDLSKMTFLKRPAVTEKSATPENAPTMDYEPTIPTETERPVIDTTPSKGSMENKPESPLGIEFPFRKRTPSKSSRASPTPTTTPTKANAQSLLALLKAPTPEVTKERSDVATDQSGTKNEQIKPLLDVLKRTPKGKSEEPAAAMEETEPPAEPEASVPTVEPEEVESLGTEREMKLIAMLERALARGVPS